MEPTVSVLLPVYGVEPYIEKCLLSLFENTIADKCEFIIVNDCTKDNSIKKVQEIKNQYPALDIKIIEHEKNLGLAGARNTGLSNASGKYVIFCDSDDWVEKNYLEELYSAAEKEDADIVGCDWIEERPGKSIPYSHNLCSAPKKNFEDFLKCKVYGYIWAKMIRRNLFIENNFTWVQGINNWEDECISIKLFSVAKKIAYVQKPLYHYICRNSSYIHSILSEKTANEFLNAISTMENYLDNEKWTEYKPLLNYKKIHVKQKLLFDGTQLFQKKYLHIWPEILPYINKDSTLNQRGRIILTLAEKIPFMAKILLFMLTFLKITLRKQYTWKQYFAK